MCVRASVRVWFVTRLFALRHHSSIVFIAIARSLARSIVHSILDSFLFRAGMLDALAERGMAVRVHTACPSVRA